MSLTGPLPTDAWTTPGTSELPDNVEGNLAAYYRDFIVEGLRRTEASLQTPATDGVQTLGAPDSALQFDSAGRPLVDVWTTGPTSSVAAQLDQLGVQVLATNEPYHLVEGWLDAADLLVVARLPGVLSVTPVYRPMRFAGSVQTQGDAVMQADKVRAVDADQDGQPDYDGSPVLVGVMSDSALEISGSQRTADLPPSIDRYLEIPIIDFEGTPDDEGRAMLEIVHDVAPGARLAHHSAIQSETSFAQGIRELAKAGARVICDDVVYFTEPFFQDGIVAQAVDDVVNTYGVTYVSAAGNDADRSYKATFTDAGSGFHDFDPAAAVDTRQQITVPADYRVTLILQWDDPFYTTNGVTHDFQVRVYDAAGVEVLSTVGKGTTNNLATQQPLEVVSWKGSGAGIYQVEIQRVAGSGTSQIQYVLSTNSDVGTIDEYATHSGTVHGHAAAAGAIAVGAVPYYSPDNIEPYSSWGDATIYFDPAGTRLTTPQVRPKPDVVAPDNANTTFFGRDIPQDPDVFPNFPGTSAAAPHVAGVAALLLDVNPHLTRAELYQVLTSTAVDLGAPGRDTVYGFGRVDAEAARLAAAAVTDITGPTASLFSPATTSGWDVTSLTVRFTEPLTATAAANPANYRLVEDGANPADPVDDVAYTVAVNYNDDAREAKLTFTAPGTRLPIGHYHLTLDGTNGLADPTGNPLNGGLDQVIPFTIEFASDIRQLEGAEQLDVRPDGTAVVIYPDQAVISPFAYPQIMVGEFDTQGVSSGPYHSIPVDIIESYSLSSPDVAVNGINGVLVYTQHKNSTDNWIGYQLFDTYGREVGRNSVVAWTNQNFPDPARVAMNQSGAFVIAFRDCDASYQRWLYGRLFRADGTALGAPFRINAQANAGNQAVALADDGTSIFVWDGPYGTGAGIVGRRYSASGEPLGEPFAISVSASSGRQDPNVAVAADGSFVVTWSEVVWSNQRRIWMKRFDALGNPLGKEVLVANLLSSEKPSIAMSPDGRFVVAWRFANVIVSQVQAQRFAADGSSVGNPVWISQGGGAVDDAPPHVGMADNGDFVVQWQSGGKAYARWISWTGANPPIPMGPWVRSMSPTGLVNGPVSQFSVTFDRPVASATFDASDVRMWDPVGRSLSVTSVTAIDSQTYVVRFPALVFPGQYRIEIGPNVADTVGNLMNQDGDSTNGETSDFFADTLELSGTIAALPLTETFESGSVDSLDTYWSFVCPYGTIGVVSSPVHGGGYALQASGGGNQWTNRDAVLHVDLVGQTGVTLDYWVQGPGSDSISIASISVDGGTTWTQLQNTWSVATYQHYAFDLDALHLTYSHDTQIKFTHSTFYAGSAAWDDIRVVTGLDVFGPRVVSQTPTGSLNGPISSFQVMFNEPIASFPLNQANLIGPAGGAIMPTSVSSTDNLTWTVRFPPQGLAGHYLLGVGPNVLDVAGNAMNQNGDALQGDGYSGSFDISAQSAAVPISEGFEAGTIGGLGAWWSFVCPYGTIGVVSSPVHGGGYALQASGGGNQWTNRDAVLHMDLAGQTGVTLDYWVQGPGSDSISIASISVDGGTMWTQLQNTMSVATYQHYAFDLDALHLTYSQDTQIKFTHSTYYTGSAAWDDIRVATGLDVFGPRVISQTPIGSVNGPISSVNVTFSEPMDASSFTAADVTLTGPGGNSVALAATNPIVDSGDHKMFTINFATGQALAGHYPLTVGPNVLDLAGNAMNQNNDALQGDGYSGAFDLTTTALSLQVVQGFEVGDIGSLAGWNAACTSGSLSVLATNPVNGTYALQMYDATSHGSTSYYQDAVLHVDLVNGSTPATGVALDFWLKEFSGGGRADDFSVSFSTNGTAWMTPAALTVAGASTYEHYAFLMDSLGLTYTHDVQIKFHHNSYYAGGFALDDLRVRANALPLNHAPTLTTVVTITGGTEDQGYPISYSALAAAADEADVDGDPLSFRVGTVTSGTLTKGVVQVTAETTLLSSGESLLWTPATDANGTLNAFTIRAWDGDLASGTPVQVKVTVGAVNDAPVLATSGNSPLTAIAEDTTAPAGDTVASFANAGITDVDSGALKGIAVVGLTGTANGIWQYYIGSAWTAFGTVSETSARLLRDTDKLRFVPNTNYNGTATVSYRAWDRTTGTAGGTADLSGAGATGGTTAYSTGVATATITVTPVNDAPVLDNSGTMMLDAIPEDDPVGAGTLVSQIIASAGGDRIADVDAGALEGIAVTAVTNTNGTWQFSTAGGTSWTPFGSPSSSSSRLLADDANTRVRFVPNLNYSGNSTGSITFRAWDQTSGTNGGTASTSSNGGITAFSTATEVASVTVTAVNDAPTLAPIPDPAAIQEDAGQQTVNLGGISAGGGESQPLQITAASSNVGLIPNPTVTYTSPNTTGSLSYTPVANQNGTATITVTVTDGGLDGNLSTAEDNGGFLQTFTITVTAVNDAPTGVNDGLSSIAEDSGKRTISFASLLANDSAGPANESGQMLTITAVGSAVGGAVTLNGTNVEFTPTEDFNGPASFVYTLQDNGTTNGLNAFLTSTATVNFTVTEVNDAPTGVNDGLSSVAEDSGTRTISFASLL
ncbi:MAG: tandem-95 repeat protein, partial [Planctomycetota bacterium]|nr:tandem-95 repeat protein [Planctomycetota bacterium]